MKIIDQKNGYVIRINENPDVQHLPENERYQLVYPDGSVFSGSEKAIRKMFERETK